MGGDKRNVLASQEEKVILQVRGDPKEEFMWFIKDTELRRKINLDYKGEYCRNLNQSVLRDLLKSSRLVQSNVALAIRDYTWDVFVYSKFPALKIKSVKYEKPYLQILLSQSDKLVGDFTIQVRDTERSISPTTISRVRQLEDKTRTKIDLPPGKISNRDSIRQ